eukprot:TRINITY_DN28723_c0_g6_i1.p1 TRINITY_DN28723_c0_g6~~TRINITY_DN28723_c0_g6_i1.p1  ORF type:complete len:1255 (+),score=349.79 TRINITY_DN28723_c0_g6_i1:72-3767(+)
MAAAAALLALGAAGTVPVALPSGSWPVPQADPARKGWSYSVGNHRYVVQVGALPAAAGGAVAVTLDWRRRDSAPLSKDSFIVSAQSHLRVRHCARTAGDPAGEKATYVFEASDGPGEYHLYFLPFYTCEYADGACKYGANSQYVTNATGGCADGNWWGNKQPAPPSGVALQSRDAFSTFSPSEFPAQAAEQQRIAAAAPPGAAAVAVGVDRSQPLRMRRAPPYGWAGVAAAGGLYSFAGSCQPGEHYTFQVGLWAHKSPVGLSSVSFTDLRSKGGAVISAAAMRCMNTAGTDYWGRPYAARQHLPKGHVLPLWMSLRVPQGAAPGDYSGSLTLALDQGAVHVAVSIFVAGPVLTDGGDSEAWRGTRLQWLDSDLAVAGDTVPPPYTPISAKPAAGGGLQVSMLDKAVLIGPGGLPQTIRVGTAAAKYPQANAIEADALAAPVAITAAPQGGAAVPLAPQGALAAGAVTNMSVAWTAALAGPSGVKANITASLDCTGYMDYRVDIAGAPAGMEFAVTVPAKGLLAMGLGLAGDYLDALPARPSCAPVWVAVDMGESVLADAAGVYAPGDGVHDPATIRLQVGDSAQGPWRPVGSFEAAPGRSGLQELRFGDQLTLAGRYWRFVVDSTASGVKCAPARVAEFQLHAAGGGWVQNVPGRVKATGSSGDSGPGNAAAKAVDGVLEFAEGSKGWEAAAGAAPAPAADLVADWKWDGVNGNNAAWVGSSSAGLRLFPKGADDLWQAAVPFDSKLTPQVPREWDNEGSGGIRIWRNGTISARTGTGAAGTVSLRFSLMVTPVRPLDLPKHYSERYVQLGGDANFTFLAQGGATVANMHQGNPINPWINYPYLTNDLMRSAADRSHANGMRFKIYNTMRELSNRCREIWAMLALNETYVTTAGEDLPDAGQGADWLQEHVQYGYEIAWSNPVTNGADSFQGISDAPPKGHWYNHPDEQDAAIKVKALSRWNNYYIEGLRQMQGDFGYDGLYLDEIAYDRVTMLRAKKVLGERGLIDHHSDKGGFTPSPAANYLELYPFIDSLWYGEGFNYEAATPGYWLAEMSGIPHGLNADMLRYSGSTPHHFKGMLFASTNRWQCALNDPVGSCPYDPRAIWQLWEDFGIENATMWGWWMEKERGQGTLPVTASAGEVKVTTYVRKGHSALLAIASWSSTPANVTLSINWAQLGLDSGAATLRQPQLKPMQAAAADRPPQGTITVPAAQGLLLTLEPRAPRPAARRG